MNRCVLVVGVSLLTGSGLGTPLTIPGDSPRDEEQASVQPDGSETGVVEFPSIPEDASLADSVAILRGAGLAPDQLGPALEQLFEHADDSPSIEGDVLAHARLSAGLVAAQAGLLSSATTHFREADLATRSRVFRTTARSNLGHLLYRGAMEAMAPDPQSGGVPDFDGVIEALRSSADAFRSVLDVDPSDRESARNVERVRRAIDRIEQIQNQVQEQAEQMRQQADQLDELADRQQQESMENDQQAQPQDEAERDQSSLNEETQQQSEQMQQQPGSEGAQEQIEQALENQQRAQEALERGDPQEASDAQREAARQLREAAKQLREQADQNEGQQGQQGESEPSDPSDQESAEPQEGEQQGESRDDRVAQWLLDREERQRERRDQQQRSRRGRSAPAEKDW